MSEDELTLDQVVDYIWHELPSETIEQTLITRELIMQILEIETEYMIRMGYYEEEE